MGNWPQVLGFDVELTAVQRSPPAAGGSFPVTAHDTRLNVIGDDRGKPRQPPEAAPYRNERYGPIDRI